MNKIQLKNVIVHIFDYLDKMNIKGAFPARTFYGETYTALGMYITDKDRYQKTIENIIKYYKNKDKTDEEFHWEFNNYALINLYKKSKDKNILELFEPLKFKGTRCTNWTILRGLCRINLKQTFYGMYEIIKKVLFLQEKSGFIKDNLQVNSFQYHCFSMALIGEAYELTGNKFLKRRFMSAINFIFKFILDNGSTNYIGRGQEQIFGYGPLIYSLELAYKYTSNIYYKERQKLVFEYLLQFKRNDGSFPLVLRKDEIETPNIVDVNNDNFLGWYRYNNYYDYLPFFGYYLAKTLEIFQEVDDIECKENLFIYESSKYYIHKNKNYKAVLATPGGYITNDMPIPYISFNKQLMTPCYGGEEYDCKLYSVEGIPLPWGILKKSDRSLIKDYIFKLPYIKCENLRSILKDTVKKLFKKECIPDKYYFRNELIYQLNKNMLIGENYRIKHIRKFDFFEEKIEITDYIIFKQRITFKEFYPIHLLFYNVKQINERLFCSTRNSNMSKLKLKVANNKISCFINDKKYYCAIDKLDCINCKLENITFEKNYELKLQYTIYLGEYENEK